MIDVEPTIKAELDGLVPVPSGARASWRDVCARAGRRERFAQSPRRLVVVVAAATAIVIAASAYAVARYFGVGDPAPAEVKREIARFHVVKGELIPRARRPPTVLPEETRVGAALRSSVGDVYLWVAPTRDGDECRYLQIVRMRLPDGRPNMSGGCGMPLGKFDVAFQMTNVEGRMLRLLHGAVPPRTASVEIEAADGETTRVDVAHRHVLIEINRDARRLRALDAAGAVLGEQTYRSLLDRPRLLDVPPGQRPVIEILTRRTRKPLRLYVVERDGKRCLVLKLSGGMSSGGCAARSPRPHEIPIGPNQIGTGPRGMLLLWGEVGRGISSLELRFEQGRVERLPLVDHLTLYQVARRDFAAGRRPIALVGRDASGKVIARRRLGPWAG